MVSNNPNDANHFKQIPISKVDMAYIELEDQLEEAQGKLAEAAAVTAGMVEAKRELDVAKSECHQILIALKPWISGNPDRSHLDLAHFSSCAFRAWGAVGAALRYIDTPSNPLEVKPCP